MKLKKIWKNEIKKDMEDIITKDEKKLEINIICKIIQMKNKIVKCYDKLRENNIYLEKNINKNDNEPGFEENDDDDNDNENDNEKNEIYDERKFNIDNTNSVLFPGKNNTTFDLNKKKYIIFSKGKIYESKYESIPKSKLSKIFFFNSPNQIKNYIYNLPLLITNNSNIILKESNDKKKEKLIYTLSDIKNLESKSNLRKSTINSMIMPVKFQTLEIEKQISKLRGKEKEKEKEKEKWNEKENNLQNLYNKNDEIQNNNNKNELNSNIIKSIKDNNNANNTILNNNFKQNNNYISNKCMDNIGYENKNNITGMNNNNLQIDNNANSEYNILLKYLLSSSILNKRLINQIIFGKEQTNLIPGISNRNLLEYIINNNIDGNIINNINDNCPTLNDIQNNGNSNRIDSINPNLNSLNNNNINENMNLSNEKNIFNDAQNINIIPSYGISNNIQPFYNLSLLNRNNINTFPNEISLNKNNLIRNSLNSLNDLIGVNASSGNLNMNSNIQTKTNLNNFNFCLNNQNII